MTHEALFLGGPANGLTMPVDPHQEHYTFHTAEDEVVEYWRMTHGENLHPVTGPHGVDSTFVPAKLEMHEQAKLIRDYYGRRARNG